MPETEKTNIGVFALVEAVPEDRRQIAESIASELDFMEDTLEALKAHIAEYGAVEWYVNGKQECWRESPALKSYNAMVQRYSLLYKQLCSLLPEATEAGGDELDEWLKAGK